MRCATVAEIRALDKAARDSAWLEPGASREDAIMCVAARALADEMAELSAHFPVRPEIFAVAGNGDNGGDALLAASLLAADGFRVRVLRLSDLPSWAGMPVCALPKRAIALDGILGIGLRGAPRPDAAAAIDWTNRFRLDWPGGRRLVVAVDIPSGVVADTGEIPGACVRADFTVTMGLPKAGMLVNPALAKCGEICVADIGYPEDSPFEGSETETGAFPELFCLRDFSAALPPRANDSNKGDFGHVVVVASSERYCGAGALAALGALRGGAGLVSAFVPRAVVPLVASRAPELMVAGYDASSLRPGILRQMPFNLRGRVLACGPGLSREPGVAEAVVELATAPGLRAAVLDADALRSDVLDEMALRRSRVSAPPPLVITPHPGEAARLLGVSVPDVQADRRGAARALADRFGAVALLKGAGSLVAAPGVPTPPQFVVAAGNPALAKGGSGDLLCGLCAALLARGVPPRESAAGAALLHGRIADRAVLRVGPESFLLSDWLGRGVC